MSDNADFSQLTEKVNESQAKIKAAASDQNVDLTVGTAKAAQTQTEAATGWQAMKDKWQSHVADLHQKADDKKAERDARRAELKAEAAEDYADDAVSFAIAAVQEAEYAAMDAILARYDADALAGTN